MARRRISWPVLLTVPSLVGMLAVVAAIGAGVPPRRLWPVAAFLFVWGISGTFELIAGRALRRRTFRLRGAPVPRGVPLKAPLWIRSQGLLMMTGLGGALGAIVALLRFPGVAVGILLVAVGLLCTIGANTFSNRSTLTFDDVGLRIDVRSARCLVPWTSIVAIEPMGPHHHQFIGLRLDDLDRVLSTVSPDGPRNRERIVGMFGGAQSALGHIVFEPWTAGLDGQTLERAIREGMSGRRDHTN